MSFPVLGCEFTIAKIVWKTDLKNTVSIFRNGSSFFISEDNRELCYGDKITIPQHVVPVTLWYYTSVNAKEEISESKTDYLINKNLEVLCGFTCKIENEIVILWKKLISHSSINEIESVSTRSHDDSKPLFMPLAAGKAENIPFKLFSGHKFVDIFWFNGKAPFNIIMKDMKGKTIYNSNLKERKISLSFTKNEINTYYKLIIKDATTKEYVTDILFTIPHFPISSKKEKFWLFSALLKEKENWRLEIWQQLNSLPDSLEKKIFTQHLINDDF